MEEPQFKIWSKEHLAPYQGQTFKVASLGLVQGFGKEFVLANSKRIKRWLLNKKAHMKRNGDIQEEQEEEQEEEEKETVVKSPEQLNKRAEGYYTQVDCHENEIKQVKTSVSALEMLVFQLSQAQENYKYILDKTVPAVFTNQQKELLECLDRGQMKTDETLAHHEKRFDSICHGIDDKIKNSQLDSDKNIRNELEALRQQLKDNASIVKMLGAQVKQLEIQAIEHVQGSMMITELEGKVETHHQNMKKDISEFKTGISVAILNNNKVIKGVVDAGMQGGRDGLIIQTKHVKSYIDDCFAESMGGVKETIEKALTNNTSILKGVAEEMQNVAGQFDELKQEVTGSLMVQDSIIKEFDEKIEDIVEQNNNNVSYFSNAMDITTSKINGLLEPVCGNHWFSGRRLNASEVKILEKENTKQFMVEGQIIFVDNKE